MMANLCPMCGAPVHAASHEQLFGVQQQPQHDDEQQSESEHSEQQNANPAASSTSGVSPLPAPTETSPTETAAPAEAPAAPPAPVEAPRAKRTRPPRMYPEDMDSPDVVHMVRVKMLSSIPGLTARKAERILASFDFTDLFDVDVSDLSLVALGTNGQELGDECALAVRRAFLGASET